MNDAVSIAENVLSGKVSAKEITQAALTRIVARNDESAFLTKHLRAYGGTGEYEGYKIGRSLRDISFSGKGLVSKHLQLND